MSDTADTGGEVLSCDEVVTTHYEGETLAHFEEGLWREKGGGGKKAETNYMLLLYSLNL